MSNPFLEPPRILPPNVFVFGGIPDVNYFSVRSVVFGDLCVTVNTKTLTFQGT